MGSDIEDSTSVTEPFDLTTVSAKRTD